MSEHLATWTAEDKRGHAIAGVAVGAIAAHLVDKHAEQLGPVAKRVIALLPVIVVGVGKEIADHQSPRHHDSDWRDAVATIAGGVIAAEIVLRF